jgi:hypothetical protein
MFFFFFFDHNAYNITTNLLTFNSPINFKTKIWNKKHANFLELAALFHRA